MRIALGAGVRRGCEHILQLRVVQGIVQAGDHPGRIAERRVRRDICDALTVEPDFAPIAQALQVFLAGQGRVGVGLSALRLDLRH